MAPAASVARMSYDNWLTRTPDDHPSVEDPELHGDGNCDCHCERCGAELSLDPIYGKVYARCGDCFGGGEIDGEAFRGGEAVPVSP